MTRPITRRALTLGLSALAAPAFAAPPALAPLNAQDRALVDRATAYLQTLGQAKARFVQTDARGRNAPGVVYLKRPGKARFAYDAPSSLLVVSDGNYVSVSDRRLKTFERYPLMSTPLSLFLAREVRFDRGVVISRVSRMADGFSITARDGKKAAEGEITLMFSDSPLRLEGWTITDAQRRSTRVQLTNLAPASGLDPALFVLKDPRQPNIGRGKL